MGRRAESDRDSSSELEEISADDFRREKASKGAAASVVAPNGGPGNKGVWMGYTNPPYSLYSFAWAQAVQNKPLMANASAEEEEEVERESDGDVEKEEGEIEEGEIGDGVAAAALPKEAQVVDLASPEANEAQSQTEGMEEEVEEEEEDGDFDSRVAEILEDLETVTADEALK